MTEPASIASTQRERRGRGRRASRQGAGNLPLDTRQGRGVIAATVLASGMVFLDGTIANVAVRRIGVDFHADFPTLQWVLNGYTLALASLILLGGSLGDHLGRRRIFLIGVCWFALASLCCALAPNATVLIGARVLQGIGGALLTPGSLALIQATFRPIDRGRAVGMWSGMAGTATAAGPLVGGYLVEHASWRWAFAINVPFAIAAVICCLRSVPESRHAGLGRQLDLTGTALVALSLALLTYGTTLAGTDGWGPRTLGISAVGVLVLLVFIWAESRRRRPLLPLGLFRNSTFAGSNLMTFTTYGALSAMLFLFVLQLQVSAGYGPLVAGLAPLPLPVLMLFLSARAGALASRTGPRLLMTVGPVIAAAGMALTTRLDGEHRNFFLYVLPAMVVFGLGMSCLVAPLTAAVMGAVPAEDVGIASGVNNAVSRTAGLLMVAVLPPLAGLTGNRYRNPADMTHSYRIAVVICIALLLAGAVAVLFTVGRATGQQTVGTGQQTVGTGQQTVGTGQPTGRRNRLLRSGRRVEHRRVDRADEGPAVGGDQDAQHRGLQ